MEIIISMFQNPVFSEALGQGEFPLIGQLVPGLGSRGPGEPGLGRIGHQDVPYLGAVDGEAPPAIQTEKAVTPELGPGIFVPGDVRLAGPGGVQGHRPGRLLLLKQF